MNEHSARPMDGYRQQIASTLTAVRPLPAPARRTWALVPLGLLLTATAPLLTGGRGDLVAYSPQLTWGATGLQALVGLWLLALGFREAVPGRNVSRQALTVAAALTVSVVLAITLLTNEASATVVPPGRALRYWTECVLGPMAVGTPFMILVTLLAARRAFPTRPAVAGALCGMSAGVLSDAGWRLTCWISEPAHIIGSHGFAILGLAAAGALLAIVADRSRWRRFRTGRPAE